MQLELEQVHTVSATTARLVSQMASHVRELAHHAGRDRPPLEDLAAALDALAEQANTAMTTVDGCLESAVNHTVAGTPEPFASSCFGIAAELITTLNRTLDAAVAVYARACESLADSVSIAEEHLDSSSTSEGGPLSAVALGRAARTLKQTLSTSTRAG
jgi:hypothetical protein